MVRNIDVYSKDEFNSRYRQHEGMLAFGVMPCDNPRAFLLGGQSGAGKTRLHKVCSQILEDNVIVINGDEFRRSHPHFADIQERYGVDAPAHTAQWSGAMTEALINAFSHQHYNLVIEGTLRTSDVPMRTARLLRERGYGVSLAIMAVKPEVSLMSCQIRYEMMRIAGTTPRATDPTHHNKIVHDIVDNLDELEQSDLFEGVVVYDRAGSCLYPAEDNSLTASEVLRDVLFGPWSAEEEDHYSNLKRQLEDLRAR